MSDERYGEIVLKGEVLDESDLISLTDIKFPKARSPKRKLKPSPHWWRKVFSILPVKILSTGTLPSVA